LLAVLGGVICTWLASCGRIGWELQHSRYYDKWYRYGLGDHVYGLFHLFGIEDWRIKFAIGATVGILCAVVWLRRYWRPTTP
jgi:hypothetical protein